MGKYVGTARRVADSFLVRDAAQEMNYSRQTGKHRWTETLEWVYESEQYDGTQWEGGSSEPLVHRQADTAAEWAVRI